MLTGQLLIEFLRKCTDPSRKPTLTPPGCKLHASERKLGGALAENVGVPIFHGGPVEFLFVWYPSENDIVLLVPSVTEASVIIGGP